jgi:hypothetical protein
VPRADDLSRDDLIRGLSGVVERLTGSGRPAGIFIVGGAALALRYFDRDTTSDVDARFRPNPEVVAAAAAEVAAANGWSGDWLNSNATPYIPTFAKEPAWEPLYDDGNVCVAVASAEALLAMKLHAARVGRDDDDIAMLLSICDVSTVDAAEVVYERYYPREGLKQSAHATLRTIFEVGLPPKPSPPAKPTLRVKRRES